MSRHGATWRLRVDRRHLGCIGLFFFGYAAIRDASGALFEHLDLHIPPFAGPAIVYAIGGGLAMRFRYRERVQTAAMIFALVVATISSGALLHNLVRFNATAADAPVVDLPAATTAGHGGSMNVFYIILDAYPGKAGLLKTFGFDNTPFIERMASRGFRDISTERSNYLITSQELGAIFLLDYSVTGMAAADHGSRLYPTLLEHGSVPPLLSRMRASGYASWHSASVWGECPGRHFKCLGQTSPWSVDYMTQGFLAQTPMGRPLLYVLGRRHDALASISHNLGTLLTSRVPVFVFGHHLSPHPPYLLDARCNEHEVRSEEMNSWDPVARDAFIAALQCVNLQVERLTDEILRKDPDALIVFQGDHGSAFTLDWSQPLSSWPEAAIRERTSFLNLVRAPAGCQSWLDHPLGQVNTARFVVGCVEQRAPDYLPERTYLSSYVGADKDTVRAWQP